MCNMLKMFCYIMCFANAITAKSKKAVIIMAVITAFFDVCFKCVEKNLFYSSIQLRLRDTAFCHFW